MPFLSQSTATLFRRGVHRGWLNLRRDRAWMGSLGALLGVFLLIQMLLSGLILGEAVERVLRQRTDLRLELEPGLTDQAIREFIVALQELPAVADARYITKEQAYEQARTADPDLVAFLEEFGLENPFRDTVGVTLRALDDYDSFVAFLEQPRWQRTVNPRFLSQATGQEAQVRSLLRLTSAGRSLGTIVLGIGIAALLFIVTELTRAQALARHDEVLVERLVGAQTLSIVIPFATEALALLMAAIIGSALLGTLLLGTLPLLVPELQNEGILAPLRSMSSTLFWSRGPLLLALEILLAPALAWAGAWLGIAQEIRSTQVSMLPEHA